MEPSISLLRELVRRRISKTVYEKEYQECKAKIEAAKAWKAVIKQDKDYQVCKAKIEAAKVWEADLEREQKQKKNRNQKKTEYDQELFPAEQYAVKKAANKKPELKPVKKYSLWV
jgi:hypothetical protein